MTVHFLAGGRAGALAGDDDALAIIHQQVAPVGARARRARPLRSRASQCPAYGLEEERSETHIAAHTGATSAHGSRPGVTGSYAVVASVVPTVLN
eukprot:COSAG03_NODE_2432_length_2777_cov_1.721060_2_plen_95_part_00